MEIKRQLEATHKCLREVSRYGGWAADRAEHKLNILDERIAVAKVIFFFKAVNDFGK